MIKTSNISNIFRSAFFHLLLPGTEVHACPDAAHKTCPGVGDHATKLISVRKAIPRIIIKQKLVTEDWYLKTLGHSVSLCLS
jgi:hypothetical protein